MPLNVDLENLRSHYWRSDNDRRPGRFILTGSSSLLRVRGTADSLAGRVARLTMYRLSHGEALGAAGAYPEIRDVSDRIRATWIDSHLQGVIGRDRLCSSASSAIRTSGCGYLLAVPKREGNCASTRKFTQRRVGRPVVFRRRAPRIPGQRGGHPAQGRGSRRVPRQSSYLPTRAPTGPQPYNAVLAPSADHGKPWGLR